MTAQHAHTDKDSGAGGFEGLASLGLTIKSTCCSIRASHRHDVHHSNGDNKRKVNCLNHTKLVSGLRDDTKHHDHHKRDHEASHQRNQPVVSANSNDEKRKKKAQTNPLKYAADNSLKTISIIPIGHNIDKQTACAAIHSQVWSYGVAWKTLWSGGGSVLLIDATHASHF